MNSRCFPWRTAMALVFMASAAGPAAGQLALPDLAAPVGETLGRIERSLEPAQALTGRLNSAARDLAQQRLRRIDRLVRANSASVECDRDGQPARKGELLMVDPAPEAMAVASKAGFALLGEERLEELGVSVVRVSVPDAMSLAAAQRMLAKLLPDAQIAADALHFQSGTLDATGIDTRAARETPIDAPVGMIDGGPSSVIGVDQMRGFAAGSPSPSDHGTAVASLLHHAGVRHILAADVYGSDPAGGNALAIARALDWLIGRGAKVVSISLVGPQNALLGKAVMAAQRRGVTLVAAVGNDGPSAPPVFPASYPGVLAVTATDGRNRALIEAGRASHLDYAAPGADMLALNAAGKAVRVRGTSFAVPFVAARAAAGGSAVRARLDAEAVDLGPRGADATYGRGLVCGMCRRVK